MDQEFKAKKRWQTGFSCSCRNRNGWVRIKDRGTERVLGRLTCSENCWLSAHEMIQEMRAEFVVNNFGMYFWNENGSR
jgi:hypothetical protein